MLKTLSNAISLFRACPCQTTGKIKCLCCGGPFPRNRPPLGIRLIPGFLSTSECEELMTHVSSELRKTEKLGVVDKASSTANTTGVKASKNRITYSVDTDDIQAKLQALIHRACTELIHPQFDESVEWFEMPRVLRYDVGGRYKAHADNEQFMPDQGGWVKVLDRDLSLLIYLNDDYEGGALDFYFFGYSYKPKTGDLIIFPSDHRYVHEAMTVTRGQRFSIVSWVKFRETPMVKTCAPGKIVRLSN